MRIFTVPIHIGDFLGGVIHMDGLEIGAYTMLLLAHYQLGPQGLPDDDKKLARIAKISPKQWSRIRETVLEKFELRGSFWVNVRVIQELQKVSDISAQNSAKALKRHNPTPAAAQPEQSQPLTLNQEPKKEPPLPPAKGILKGVLKPSVSGEGGRDDFDIRDHLSDTVVAEVRKVAPGWDVYGWLAQIYNEGIHTGDREIPHNPAKAFPAWCKSYTKGKPP